VLYTPTIICCEIKWNLLCLPSQFSTFTLACLSNNGSLIKDNTNFEWHKIVAIKMALSPEWEPLCANRIGGWASLRTLLEIMEKVKFSYSWQDPSKDCSVDQPVARSLYRLPPPMYRVGQTGWRVKRTHMHARTQGKKMRCPFSVLIVTVQPLLLQKVTTVNDQKTITLTAGLPTTHTTY